MTKKSYNMIKIKPTVNKKVLEPKEIETKSLKPKKKSDGGMSNKDKNKKVIPLMPQGVIYKGKAKDYPGIKKIIKDKYKKSQGGSMESEGPLRQRATYGQKSEQKKFERKQKIMKRTKGGSTEFGMRMGGYLGSETSKRQGPSKYATPPKKGKSGYGAARKSGMGLQDETMKPGKIMKRTKGGSTEFGMLSVKAGIDKNPNPTAADRIAGAKMKTKKAAMGALIGFGADKAMKQSQTARDIAGTLGLTGEAMSKFYNRKYAGKKAGGMMKKGYGAARQSGMGLEDENLTPGKTMDYYKDLI